MTPLPHWERETRGEVYGPQSFKIAACQKTVNADFIAAASPDVVLALLAELAEKDAEIKRLMSDRAKAGRAIYEAQRPAFALLESSGAPKVENRERTPEQAALVELYSLVHNAAKLLVGRRDIEHNDLTEANTLASEWRMEYATMRSERDAAEVRASTAEAVLAKVQAAVEKIAATAERLRPAFEDCDPDVGGTFDLLIERQIPALAAALVVGDET